MQILSASDTYVAPHERHAFEALRKELLRDFQPLNSVEAEFASAALRAAWTIRRCDAAERDLALELGCDPLLSDDKRLGKIRQTRTQEQREFRMALAQLRRLQTDQAIRKLKENQGLQALPVPIDAKQFIQAARAAGGIAKNQRICFPPIQAALDEFVRNRGDGDTAWEAWFQRAGRITQLGAT